MADSILFEYVSAPRHGVPDTESRAWLRQYGEEVREEAVIDLGFRSQQIVPNSYTRYQLQGTPDGDHYWMVVTGIAEPIPTADAQAVRHGA